MNNFTQEFFTTTTAEDQNNYFSGIAQSTHGRYLDNGNKLPSGNYKIVDGELFRIVSGLPLEQVRKRIKESSIG